MASTNNSTFSFQFGWKETSIESCICFDGTSLSVVTEEELFKEVNFLIICVLWGVFFIWFNFLICYRPVAGPEYLEN